MAHELPNLTAPSIRPSMQSVLVRLSPIPPLFCYIFDRHILFHATTPSKKRVGIADTNIRNADSLQLLQPATLYAPYK